MLKPEDENDADVRREDQDRINRFARLNARLQDLRMERQELKRALESLDDASTELMMGGEESGTVMILAGEAFMETTEDDAVQYCDKQIEKLQEESDKLEEEEKEIVAEQATLKSQLYGRFGKSINLES